MEPIIWALSTIIGLLLLVVLLLGLLGAALWLLRWTCRVWREGAVDDRQRAVDDQ